MSKTLIQDAAGGHEFVNNTGTGSAVLSASPTFTGALTADLIAATTYNKLTITTPATGSTLTITNGKTLSVSNTLTLAGTDGSTITAGTGGTIAYTSNNLSVFAATTSAQLAGIISDEQGSGALVFATSPTLTTPNIGAATATTVNGLTITASTGTLGVANGSSLLTSGAFSITLTATAGTVVTLPTSGTLYGTLAASITSAQLLSSMTDETGTGVLVFGTSPTIATANLTGITSIGGNIVATTGVQPVFKSLDQTGATASEPIQIKSGTTVSADSGTMGVFTGAVQTLGNSGAVSVESGASSVAGNSGAANLKSGGAVTGDTGLVTVASGNATTLGATGNVAITTGNATAGLSGSIIQTTGTASTVRGIIFNRAPVVSNYQIAGATVGPGADTITAAELIGGILEMTPTTGATRALTLPTGVDLANALPSGFTTSDSLDFTVINLQTTAATDTITLTASVGITIVGDPLVFPLVAARTASAVGRFRVRMSAAATFVAYRIS